MTVQSIKTALIGQVSLGVARTGWIVKSTDGTLLREVRGRIAWAGWIVKSTDGTLLREIGRGIVGTSRTTQRIGHALIHTIQQSNIGITHSGAI